MTIKNDSIPLYLKAFDCICENCRHRFEGLDFPDAEYGRRILRTISGKHLALLNCDEDKVLDEFSSMLRKATGSLSARQFGALFDKTFGIACDPVKGEPIDAAKSHVCPACGSSAVSPLDIVPQKTVLTRVFRVGHSLWGAKSGTQKERDLRAALGG